jgi:hypothetical protein
MVRGSGDAVSTVDGAVPSRATGYRPGAAPRCRRRPIVLVVSAVLAVAGVPLAAGLAGGRDGHVHGTQDGPGVAQPVRLGFGWLTVTHVEQTAGLTARDLAGMTHGISGLVRSGRVQVQVTVQLANALERSVVRYDPGQFSLLVGDETVLPATSSLRGGELQPGAAVEGRLGFVVPARGQRLALSFHDPTRAGQVLIGLGSATRAPGKPAGHGH